MTNQMATIEATLIVTELVRLAASRRTNAQVKW
jgi:hypothetical protein